LHSILTYSNKKAQNFNFKHLKTEKEKKREAKTIKKQKKEIEITMSSITTNTVVSHENAQNNTSDTKNKKRNSKSNLFNRRLIIDCIRCLHH